jgi:Ku protein
MAPARPYWKGYLKLSLVSCPIALYTGTSSTERVAFRQINKQTGNRLRQQLVDEVTRAPVESSDKGRGYEYAKNAYIPVDDDELDAIAIESNHTIEIDSFVPRGQIDERYLDNPYYITPNDQVGQEAFAVVREAMRGKGMVALGRVVLAKRERVTMLQPWNKGLMGTTLRYPYEIRDAKEYFEDIPNVKVEPDMLQWPSISSKARRQISTRHSSSIIMKKPSSRCSRKNRTASRYRASMPRRGRKTLSTSWTRSVSALHRKRLRQLRRRSGASALMARARKKRAPCPMKITFGLVTTVRSIKAAYTMEICSPQPLIDCGAFARS